MSRLEQNTSAGLDPRVVLFVAAMASFLTPFMGSSINIALPSIANDFAVDAVTLTWITTSYLLAAAMFLVPLGRLADIYGRRKVFLFGVSGYTVVSLLCGLTNSEHMLIVLRVIQGITDAMMFSTALAIVTSVYPANKRGQALGLTVAAVYTGGALGPVLGGLITQYFGWRSIFFLTTLLGGSVVVLTLWKMRAEWAEARGQKLDVPGSLIYAATLALLMYGLTLLGSGSGLWFVLLGLVGLVGFVVWEGRVRYPVLDISLFRHNITFAMSNLAALINYCTTAGVGFLVSLYLQYNKGLDPQSAGLIMLSQPIMMAVFSPLAGRLSDRIEPRVLASGGMALSAAGLAVITFTSGAPGLGFTVVGLIMAGLGFGLFSSPNQNAIMGAVDRSCYGVASATTSSMRLIGQMLSMGIAALIVALYVGDVQITPDRYPAFLSAFEVATGVFALLAFAGIFASVARGKVHRRTAEAPRAAHSVE